MLINSEKLNRELGFKKLDDEFLKKLQEVKKCHANCETALLGIHSYQILDNSQYQTKFRVLPSVYDENNGDI